jgi:hypothetical protein
LGKPSKRIGAVDEYMVAFQKNPPKAKHVHIHYSANDIADKYNFVEPLPPANSGDQFGWKPSRI